jgi:hypothetical protein
MMLRFGIIGAGLKAAEYARGWTSMPDVNIAALAEVDPASRRRLSDICAPAGGARLNTGRTKSCWNRGGSAGCRVIDTHVFHAANALAVIDAGLDLLPKSRW